MKRMRWLTPAFALAAALFAGFVPASLAQQQSPPSGPGGGCYICGTLDYVLVEGAYWFGILAEEACPRYLGDRRASPETRRAFCNKIKSKVGQNCQKSAVACDSPNGKYCGDTMPERGAVFAAGTTLPIGRVYSDASTGATITGTYPNGTRMVYTQTKQVDGQTWYRVNPPGRPAGWMPGSEVSCTRPGEPNRSFGSPPVLYPDGSTPRPTAAIVAGARG
jgi:hypothetical protein